MLGVFRRNVKNPVPLATELPGPEYVPSLKDDYLEKYFATIYPHPVIVSLGTYGFIAYSADNNISPSPRPIFSMRSGIYCVYRGHMEMTDHRRVAGDTINDVDFLMVAYVGVKEKGNKASFKAMEVLAGDYNYILYDTLVNRQGSTRGALAVNGLEGMNLYFGLDSEGCCILSDDENVMKKVCGDTYKIIPKGNALLIPVYVDSDDTGSEKVSAGKEIDANISGSSSSVAVVSKDEPTEAKSPDGSSSKKISGGGAIEASSLAVSDSAVVESKGNTSVDNLPGGSSLKKDISGEPTAASPADGK